MSVMFKKATRLEQFSSSGPGSLRHLWQLASSPPFTMASLLETRHAVDEICILDPHPPSLFCQKHNKCCGMSHQRKKPWEPKD